MVEHWFGGVCSLSMATSTAAATALVRSSPAVPAKVKPYSIKPRTGTLVYFPTRFNSRLWLAKRRCLHAVAGRSTTRRRRGAAGVMRACFNLLGDERILREAIKVNFLHLSSVLFLTLDLGLLQPVCCIHSFFCGYAKLTVQSDSYTWIVWYL
jgi:hypothetical protein